MRTCIRQKTVEETRLSLLDFLEAKPLYYAKIDYTRMPRAYASIRSELKIPKIIHLVGTNGKGTTGRFIANALVAQGLNTGHYSSPHIHRFNERIWINGAYAEDERLESAHQRLQTLLSSEFLETLSYFEYTTFLAMIVYEECDYVVLEAGLGGEHDATSVFDKLLSVITPIGMDHEDFLGNTIDAIARTKLKSVQHKAIVGKQSFDDIQQVMDELSRDGREFIAYEDALDEDDMRLAEAVAQELELASYLKENLLLAISVLKILGLKVKKNLFNSQRLEGRMQRIKPNVWLDVGHNRLAAEAIAHCFAPKSVNLIYNSYKDKDYLSILGVLAPIVKRVEIITVDDERIVERTELIKAIEDVGLEYDAFTGINEDRDYLVFGSFSVAEAFTAFC